jgi:ubiquitin-conjugating enzyme E2 J2
MLTPSGRFSPDKKICFSMSDFHPASWNPAWSVATILTGLLSFMLSDEITTGSVNTTDTDKRAWARKSHPWNIQQRKFKEAFPEYCTPTMRDLPNMGESVRGKSSDPTPSQPSQQSTHSIVEQPRAVPNPQPAAAHPATTGSKAVVEANSSDASGGWADVIWQKWRWGLFIAIAVIVSRLSSS